MMLIREPSGRARHRQITRTRAGEHTSTVNLKQIKYELLNFKGKVYKDKIFTTWMRPTVHGWQSGGHNCVDDTSIGCSSCDYWGYNATKDSGFSGHKSATSKTHYWLR